RRAAIAKPDVGERRERAGEIEGRRQQRLRRVVGRPADDSDRAPPPSFVEELDCTGRALTCNLEPRDVVAQFDRQIERRLGLAVSHAETEMRLADRRSLQVKRTYDTGSDAVVGAQYFHGHFRGSVFGP